MKHDPQEILAAFMESLNGVIEAELKRAIGMLVAPGPLPSGDHIKRFAHTKTGVRKLNGKALVEYWWQNRKIFTMHEPSFTQDGNRMVVQFVRHLENNRIIVPKFTFNPPLPGEGSHAIH